MLHVIDPVGDHRAENGPRRPDGTLYFPERDVRHWLDVLAFYVANHRLAPRLNPLKRICARIGCHGSECHDPHHFSTNDAVVRIGSRLERAGSCLEYIRGRDKNGYGRITINSKKVGAHQLAWVLCSGRFIPPGNRVVIRHSCDNPPCCNPDHLSLGTQKENARDRDSRGRLRLLKGEDHPLAKLASRQVNEIRWRFENEDVPMSRLAHDYDVSRETIRSIVRYVTWRDDATVA